MVQIIGALVHVDDLSPLQLCGVDSCNKHYGDEFSGVGYIGCICWFSSSAEIMGCMRSCRMSTRSDCMILVEVKQEHFAVQIQWVGVHRGAGGCRASVADFGGPVLGSSPPLLMAVLENSY